MINDEGSPPRHAKYRARTKSLIGAVQYLVLAGFLTACASATPWRTPTKASSPLESRESSECSLLGRLACGVMAMGSSDTTGNQQGSCIVSRTKGTRVETCSTVNSPARPLRPKPQEATAKFSPTSHGSVHLTWKDNSDNETGFVIERCDRIFRDIHSAKLTASCRGLWKIVATVGANVTTYVDNTVAVNQTYIYRVKATNPFGASAYTPEAVITAPAK